MVYILSYFLDAMKKRGAWYLRRAVKFAVFAAVQAASITLFEHEQPCYTICAAVNSMQCNLVCSGEYAQHRTVYQLAWLLELVDVALAIIFGIENIVKHIC